MKSYLFNYIENSRLFFRVLEHQVERDLKDNLVHTFRIRIQFNEMAQHTVKLGPETI